MAHPRAESCCDAPRNEGRCSGERLQSGKNGKPQVTVGVTAMPWPSCPVEEPVLGFWEAQADSGVGGDEKRVDNNWWSCALKLPGAAGRAVSFHLGEDGQQVDGEAGLIAASSFIQLIGWCWRRRKRQPWAENPENQQGWLALCCPLPWLATVNINCSFS